MVEVQAYSQLVAVVVGERAAPVYTGFIIFVRRRHPHCIGPVGSFHMDYGRPIVSQISPKHRTYYNPGEVQHLNSVQNTWIQFAIQLPAL